MQVAHMVYFELDDSSPAKVEELLAACNKYLDDHPGLVYFAVGQRDTELTREVNDQVFHVSLHTIFEDRAAHDAYQIAPRHLEFIEESKGNWKSVRVFDSLLEPK